MDKLKMKREKILALLLACTIPFSTSLSNNVYAVELEVSNEQDSNTDFDEAADDINDFFIKMASIIPVYNWESFYPTMEEIDEILAVAENGAECENTNTDYELLTDILIENSIRCSNEQNKIFSSENDLDMRLALDRAIHNIFKTPSNVAEDFCSISEYGIVNEKLEGETLGLCCYDEKLLKIDYEKIQSYFTSSKQESKFNIDFVTYLSCIVEHELNHCREYFCRHREAKGQKNESISYKDTLNFMIESAAESQVYCCDGSRDLRDRSTYDYAYYEERENESLLFLLCCFREDRKIEDYYKAIFDCDLKALYEFYGLETKEDIYTFYKIAYALDSLNVRSELSETLYYENGVTTIGEFKREIGFSYRVDLFKLSLKNLMQYIQKYDDLSIEESIFLYQFLKNYVTKDSYLSIHVSDHTYQYDETFVGLIYQLETIYDDFICNHYHVTVDDINNIRNHMFFDSIDVYNGNKIPISIGLETQIDCYELLEKFPLLKNISWTSYMHRSSFPSFDQKNKEIEKTIQ